MPTCRRVVLLLAAAVRVRQATRAFVVLFVRSPYVANTKIASRAGKEEKKSASVHLRVTKTVQMVTLVASCSARLSHKCSGLDSKSILICKTVPYRAYVVPLGNRYPTSPQSVSEPNAQPPKVFSIRVRRRCLFSVTIFCEKSRFARPVQPASKHSSCAAVIC